MGLGDRIPKGFHYQCTSGCTDKTFRLRVHWVEHEESVHKTEWKCQPCGKIFAKYESYKLHIQGTGHHYEGDRVDLEVISPETGEKIIHKATRREEMKSIKVKKENVAKEKWEWELDWPKESDDEEEEEVHTPAPTRQLRARKEKGAASSDGPTKDTSPTTTTSTLTTTLSDATTKIPSSAHGNDRRQSVLRNPAALAPAPFPTVAMKTAQGHKRKRDSAKANLATKSARARDRSRLEEATGKIDRSDAPTAARENTASLEDIFKAFSAVNPGGDMMGANIATLLDQSTRLEKEADTEYVQAENAMLKVVNKKLLSRIAKLKAELLQAKNDDGKASEPVPGRADDQST